MRALANIEALGADIERRWRELDYRRESFVEIAQRELEAHAMHRQFSSEAVLRWLYSTPDAPAQPSDDKFGQPPVLLFRAPHFYIEALFWVDGTTAIHQHGFSGAFQVLSGSSIHTRYAFSPGEVIVPERLIVGELAATTPALLRTGDVCPIFSGGRLIHSLFHLDRPSVTLVARTSKDPGANPQYSYYPPGLAFDPFCDGERLSRIRRLFGVLRDAGSSDQVALLHDLCESADLSTAALTLIDWFRARPLDLEQSERCLAVLRRRHAGLAEPLRRAMDEVRRQALVIDRRASLHRPEHRFLLALLLNVQGRRRICELVEEQYPGCAAVERIVAWVAEMAALPGTAPGESALGYDLGEAELRVFEGLVRGASDDEVIAAMAHEYEDAAEQEPALRELCQSLRSSALFRPLLAL